MTDETISPEEEQARLAEIRKRNYRMVILLVVFVALVTLASMLVIARAGFIPLDNVDLFRSS